MGSDERLAAAIDTTPDVTGPVLAEVRAQEGSEQLARAARIAQAQPSARGVPDHLKPGALGEQPAVAEPLRFGAEIVRADDGSGWYKVFVIVAQEYWLGQYGTAVAWNPTTMPRRAYCGIWNNHTNALAALNAAPPPPGWVEPIVPAVVLGQGTSKTEWPPTVRAAAENRKVLARADKLLCVSRALIELADLQSRVAHLVRMVSVEVQHPASASSMAWHARRDMEASFHGTVEALKALEVPRG